MENVDVVEVVEVVGNVEVAENVEVVENAEVVEDGEIAEDEEVVENAEVVEDGEISEDVEVVDADGVDFEDFGEAGEAVAKVSVAVKIDDETFVFADSLESAAFEAAEVAEGSPNASETEEGVEAEE